MNIIGNIKEKLEIRKLERDMNDLVNNGFDGFRYTEDASKYLEKRNAKVRDVKEKLEKYPHLFSQDDMYLAKNYLHEVDFKSIERRYGEDDSWYSWNRHVANYLTDLEKATVDYITREEEY